MLTVGDDIQKYSIFRFACPWSYYFNLGQNSRLRIFPVSKWSMYWCVKYISIKMLKKKNRAYTIADKIAIPSTAHALPALAQ